MPPFVYSLAFWKAVSLVIATLVAAFTQYKLEAAMVEALILALLQLLGVTPELRAKFGRGAWFK